MESSSTAYIHALRFRRLNGLYDHLVRFTTRESYVKSRLIDQIPNESGELLDVASGTGTLTRAVLATRPGYNIRGVDGDQNMIDKATAAASNAGLNLQYEEAFAQKLPYEDAKFDVVTSSLFFHHLTLADKRQSLEEVFRVLKPGGILLIADWGEAQNVLMRAMFLIVQCLDGFETTGDNIRGLLPGLVDSTGFIDSKVVEDIATPLGTISLLKASKEYTDANQ